MARRSWLAAALLSSTSALSIVPLRAPRAPPPIMAFGGVSMERWSDALKVTVAAMTDYRVARASHILLKGVDKATMQQLEEWKAEIADDPDKFADRARTSSLCPSRGKGGSLGYFTRGKMVKEVDAVAFGERPGACYGPVRTDFGHHLIFLHSCQVPDNGRAMEKFFSA